MRDTQFAQQYIPIFFSQGILAESCQDHYPRILKIGARKKEILQTLRTLNHGRQSVETKFLTWVQKTQMFNIEN